MANGSWADRPSYPPNRFLGRIYLSRVARTAIRVSQGAITSRFGENRTIPSDHERRTPERTFTANSYGTTKTGKIQSMGRHRRRTVWFTREVSWTTRIMIIVRSVLRGLIPPKFHREHQDNAQHEINHATAVVEQQRRDTDLLAAQVWQAMGGHP